MLEIERRFFPVEFLWPVMRLAETQKLHFSKSVIF